MKIFISYASEDHSRAEEIALALRNDGHEIFFDRTELDGGENYHQVIRDKLGAMDLFVFLITSRSIGPGYTLSELREAQERWPSPVGRVIPVLLEPVAIEDVPAYLRAVTLFEPKGNVAAELTAHVHRLGSRRGLRRWLRVAGIAMALVTAVAVWFYLDHQRRAEEPPFRSKVKEKDFVTAFVMDQLDRTEYALDPTSRFPSDRGDVVALERLAFGALPDRRKAFDIRVSVTNVDDDPIQLDLTPRFFDLVDDQGQHAELLYFCCEARGDLLPPKQARVIRLIYAAAPGWEGKETTPGMIHFRISGLLPLVRATWSFRPLATAA